MQPECQPCGTGKLYTDDKDVITYKGGPMIGGVNYASSQLSSIYNSGAEQLASTLTRIASGKKFQNASEDLLGFIKSNRLSNEISGYQKVKENLTEFKTYTTAAATAGSSIYENLTKMKSLAKQYAAAAGDTEQQAVYEAEFGSLKTQIANVFSNNKINSKDILQTTSAVSTVDLNPDGGSSLALQFTDVADRTAIASMAIDGGTILADLDAELESSQTYLSEAKTFDSIASQQLKFNETVISSKEAVKSLITDIDEAAETSKMVDQSVRQQAVVSMMAQANLAKQSVLKLYI